MPFQYGIKKSTLKEKKHMESSNEANQKPMATQSHTGVKIVFNPHWVLEIKTGERQVFLRRGGKYRRCRQRIVIIHTLMNAYHIPIRQWINHYDPLSYSILFSKAVLWCINPDSKTDGGEHIITCSKKHAFLFFIEGADTKDIEDTETKDIESTGTEGEERRKFSYLDVERVERRDGIVLWQKQR